MSKTKTIDALDFFRKEVKNAPVEEVIDVKVVKTNPFDFIKSINTKSGEMDDELVERDYLPFQTNRAFSNTVDTVLLANELNILSGMSKVMQYQYYYHTIDRKPKRFGTWHKVVDDSDTIDYIKEYYGYSDTKAREVVDLLEPHLKQIRLELYKGGKK